jgi:hypothetical protein
MKTAVAPTPVADDTDRPARTVSDEARIARAIDAGRRQRGETRHEFHGQPQRGMPVWPDRFRVLVDKFGIYNGCAGKVLNTRSMGENYDFGPLLQLGAIEMVPDDEPAESYQ